MIVGLVRTVWVSILRPSRRTTYGTVVFILIVTPLTPEWCCLPWLARLLSCSFPAPLSDAAPPTRRPTPALSYTRFLGIGTFKTLSLYNNLHIIFWNTFPCTAIDEIAHSIKCMHALFSPSGYIRRQSWGNNREGRDQLLNRQHWVQYQQPSQVRSRL